MNANKLNETLYDTFPVVSELNKVQGFDPRRFLKPGKGLELKYKKLWLRLAHPLSRIQVTALKITEQVAIVEAKVFLGKEDTEPVSSFIVQTAREIDGQLYIQSAQHTAADEALSDAGFGCQFISAEDVTATETTAAVQPAPAKTVESETPVKKTKQPAVIAEIQPEQEISDASEEQETVSEATVSEIPVDSPEKTPQEMVTETVEQEITADLPDGAPQEIVETPELPETEESGPEKEETPSEVQALRYTADMPVEEICALMTLEEAAAVVVDFGTCNGWTLAEVAQKRTASLKWYLNGYPGENNLMRAGAKLLLESGAVNKAA